MTPRTFGYRQSKSEGVVEPERPVLTMNREVWADPVMTEHTSSLPESRSTYAPGVKPADAVTPLDRI